MTGLERWALAIMLSMLFAGAMNDINAIAGFPIMIISMIAFILCFMAFVAEKRKRNDKQPGKRNPQ